MLQCSIRCRTPTAGKAACAASMASRTSLIAASPLAYTQARRPRRCRSVTIADSAGRVMTAMPVPGPGAVVRLGAQAGAAADGTVVHELHAGEPQPLVAEPGAEAKPVQGVAVCSRSRACPGPRLTRSACSAAKLGCACASLNPGTSSAPASRRVVACG